jgi:predicted alpha/beta-fold hydrolase
MLTLYLSQDGERSPLTGACAFGGPFQLEDNVEYFRTNGFRFYDFSIGFNFYQNVLKPHFPALKEHLGDEKFADFVQKLYENRFSMMDMDQRAIIPFFGYDSSLHGLKDYYT